MPSCSLWRKRGCGRNADETRTAKSKGPNALLRASEKRGPVRLGAASVPLSILARKGIGLQAQKHRRLLIISLVRSLFKSFGRMLFIGILDSLIFEEFRPKNV